VVSSVVLVALLVLPRKMHPDAFLGVQDPSAGLKEVVPVVEVTLCDVDQVAGMWWSCSRDIGIIDKCVESLFDAVAVIWCHENEWSGHRIIC